MSSAPFRRESPPLPGSPNRLCRVQYRPNADNIIGIGGDGMRDLPLRERRRRATRRFLGRVCLLLLLIGGVTYAAWLAPWARPVRSIEITTEPSVAARR